MTKKEKELLEEFFYALDTGEIVAYRWEAEGENEPPQIAKLRKLGVSISRKDVEEEE